MERNRWLDCPSRSRRTATVNETIMPHRRAFHCPNVEISEENTTNASLTRNINRSTYGNHLQGCPNVGAEVINVVSVIVLFPLFLSLDIS